MISKEEIMKQILYQYITGIINEFSPEEIEYMAKIDFDPSQVQINVPEQVLNIIIKHRAKAIEFLTLRKINELGMKYHKDLYIWLEKRPYVQQWIEKRILAPLRNWLSSIT